jgi:hypothetical protein
MSSPPTGRPKFGLISLLLVCLVGAVAVALVVRLFASKSPRANQAAPIYSQAWAQHKLAVGQPAPDFVLKSYPGGEEVRLSSLRGQTPVVLVFGSFTCDLFCKHMGRLVELYQAYNDRARFYVVYIAEAGHGLPFPSPEGGRLGRIRKGLEFFHIPFPCLVAPQDSQVEKDYDPWPVRLVLLDRDGRIAFDAGRGVDTPWDLAEFGAQLRSLPAAR